MSNLIRYLFVSTLIVYFLFFVCSIIFENHHCSKYMTKTKRMKGVDTVNYFNRQQYVYGAYNSVVNRTVDSIDHKTNQDVRTATCNYCSEHNFKYVLNNEHICELVFRNQTIDLFIVIFTQHQNYKAREGIRNSWLTISRNNTSNVRYAFLLGHIKDKDHSDTIAKENNLYKDIIKEDFSDTYRNLTYKTIMGFKWVVNFCAHAKYVMKTDDDMYVNIPNILRFVTTFGAELETSIGGACKHRSKPIRNSKSKWYASEKSYKEQYYPSYCSGTGYITSFNIVKKIYKVSASIPFFYLEDIYVALCLFKIGGHARNIAGFSSGRRRLDPCLYKGNKLFTSHMLTPKMMKTVWNGLCNQSKLNI